MDFHLLFVLSDQSYFDYTYMFNVDIESTIHVQKHAKETGDCEE